MTVLEFRLSSYMVGLCFLLLGVEQATLAVGSSGYVFMRANACDIKD